MTVVPVINDPRFPAEDAAVIPKLVRRHAAEHGDRVFAVFGDGETWTYAELAERVWSRANALAALGVGRGDHVSSLLPTGKAAIEAWFATNALGAVFVPLNIALRGRLLEHQLGISGARFLICHTDLIDELSACRADKLETVVAVGAAAIQFAGAPVVRWSELDAAGAGCPSSVDDVATWDDMLVLFTSGTTGPSKGVRLSYLQHYTFSQYLFPPEVSAEDRLLNCYPMFHTAGTCATYKALQLGASLGVLPQFRTQTFWEDVTSVGATVAIVLSAMASFLQKQPRSEDDAENSLRLVLGGPLLPDFRDFGRRFGFRQWSIYGMTEIPTPLRTSLDPEDHRSCGRPVDPDYEVRVVDEYDREVPRGTAGELIVRHARPWSLNSGYKDMPEATAVAWRNGWFHTGDAFVRDENDDFFFVDRKKDTVRRRGENVSSLEVEFEITRHEAVAEAACVAVPDESTGEDEIKVCIVWAAGAARAWDDLAHALIARLPHFMVPRYFQAYDELPRSISMKVQKHLLRADGINASTWDREAHGIYARRRVLTESV